MVRHKYFLNKITFEEQLTTATHDLASAIKDNILCLLPNHDLRENINQLESIFRTSVEDTTRKILTPLAPEDTKTDLKTPIATDDLPEKLPRVLAQSPMVKERISNHPEILLKICSYKTMSPKILRNATTNQSADSYLQGTFRK